MDINLVSLTLFPFVKFWSFTPLLTWQTHVEGSKAFARYRTIDDDMKRELVDMINCHTCSDVLTFCLPYVAIPHLPTGYMSNLLILQIKRRSIFNEYPHLLTKGLVIRYRENPPLLSLIYLLCHRSILLMRSSSLMQ